MPLYRYQAIDTVGKKKSGNIEAQAIREAREKLRDQGLMVTYIQEQTKSSSKEVLKGDALVAFTLQMSQLINAGLPLYESLVAMEEQARNEPYHRILLSLCEQVKSGVSLSRAMASFPHSFDKLYCGMVAAGEQSGALQIVMDKLAFLLAKRSKLNRQMTTALIYPGVLASFSLIIIVAILGFAIPSIQAIFQGRTLNAFTETVFTISNIFRNYWWIYIPLIGLGITYFVFQMRKQAFKNKLERFLMRLPIIGNLMVQAALARFCRTMGTLQQGGLTMIDSLRIAREVMGNQTLEREIERAEHKVIEGRSLSSELNRSRWIPPIVSKMLSVGEETGNIQVMFNKIADMYEETVEKNLDRVTALIQPVILIVMGTVIGLLLLAVLLPLTDVSSITAG